jgi:hypothetical protein
LPDHPLRPSSSPALPGHTLPNHSPPSPPAQVPRLVFVNKLDRMGANPWRVIQMARDKLKLNAAAVQASAGVVGWMYGRGATGGR